MAMTWEKLLQSNKYRAYHMFTIPDEATQSLLITFPPDTEVDTWAYGVDVELAQSEGAAFVTRITNVITVTDVGTPIDNLTRLNGLHNILPRTVASVDSAYTHVVGVGIPTPYTVLLGEATQGGGSSQFIPKTGSVGDSVIVLAGGNSLVFEIENLGNDTGIFNLSVIIEEVKLPAAPFHDQLP